MTLASGLVLAVLSVWDYPSRQHRHEELRGEFIRASANADYSACEKAARAGTELLPDDPTWRYNLACSEARLGRMETAFDDLEKAIRLGFRDAETIGSDPDFIEYRNERRFKDAVDLAVRMKGERIFLGPLAVVPAKGKTGGSLALGAQNLSWDFESGCFSAVMELEKGEDGPNAGDIYFNRDGGHSVLAVTNFPGLARVRFDSVGRERGMDLDLPNVIFPCPVFGNSSRALTSGPYWRSLPRAAVTMYAAKLPLMYRFYRSNQVWVFPVCEDTPPLGRYGDVFASVTPYCIATVGRSWSDQYYLRAALAASGSFNKAVKAGMVHTGRLAPTIQSLLRHSLRGVETEDDYLTEKAHPTAMPPNGLDLAKLKRLSSEMKLEEIPPVALVAGVGGATRTEEGKLPELTYASPCAWAFVLRTDATNRTFVVKAGGSPSVNGGEYAFGVVHGAPGAARLEKIAPDTARVTIDRSLVVPSNRVDVAVFAKSADSMWSAPAFVSFAVVDTKAPYFDPVLAGVEAPQPGWQKVGAKQDVEK